jgi:hypothetical protein
VIEPQEEGVPARIGGEENDRCPHPRPFPPDFDGCPAFHPVSYLVADSTDDLLGTVVSCRHLTSGSTPGAPGRYYARCALGDAG